MERYIDCYVGETVSPNLRAFTLKLNGKIYSELTNREDIIMPENGENLGKLRVYVIDEQDDKVLVDLPRDTVNGRRVWVPRDIIR